MTATEVKNDVPQTPAIQTKVTVAHGDGIGPEIMDATLRILKAAGAQLDITEIEIGEAVYKRGHSSGIETSSWDALRSTGVFLKAPITTPQGGGFKSLNVTIRKTLGLYANVRPCRAYHPFVATLHPKMDLVIVRENEEDLYAGIEHRQTDEVYQCLKLISRPGCERIVRYAFEYAVAHGRKKITCMTKDNIMKLTDGLFHQVFDEIGAEYPQIEKEHWIIDIGMARAAHAPERFDVIVTPNLYGDIISDVTAEGAGSIGLAPSANIGASCAMFEAIHGSAPDIAGMNVANPSGLLLAAVQMLVHMGQQSVAEKVQNAWLKTLEDGIHTADIYAENTSKEKVGTVEFANAVIERLGQAPVQFSKVEYGEARPPLKVQAPERKTPAKKDLVGVDIFVSSTENPEVIAEKLKSFTIEGLPLQMITNRGVMVWPRRFPETYLTDHYRCRFLADVPAPICAETMVQLIGKVVEAGLDFIKAETLCNFDGKPGYSLGQGQ